MTSAFRADAKETTERLGSGNWVQKKKLAVTLGSLLLILTWQVKQAKKDNRCVQSLFPKFRFGNFIIVGALQVGQ